MQPFIYPTHLMIVFQNFLFSPEFLERRQYWTQYIYELVSVVKPRTIKTNYAIDYAICEKMYSIFR